MNVYLSHYVPFLTMDAYMDVGGRAKHDHRGVGGRVTPGAVTEEAKAENTEDTEVNRIKSKPSLSNLCVLRELRGSNSM